MQAKESVLTRVTDVISGLIWKRRDFSPELVKREAKLNDDIGIDSLGGVELIMMLEEKFGRVISDQEAEKIYTVGDIIDLMSA